MSILDRTYLNEQFFGQLGRLGGFAFSAADCFYSLAAA
jgi:hypothetical protein